MTTVDDRLRSAVPRPPDPDIGRILARGRRRRVVRRTLLVGALTLVPVGLLVAGLVAANHGTNREVIATGGGSGSGSPTTVLSADGTVTADLVTPRGAQFEIDYPEQMRLMGGRALTGNAALEWPVRGPDARGDSCCSRSATLIYGGDPAGLEQLTEEGRTFTNADGRPGRLLQAPRSVPLERSGPFGPRVLVFDYDEVTAVVSLHPDQNAPMSMTASELETFASSFSLDAVDGGAVLRPHPPLTVGPIDSPDLVFDGGVAGLIVRPCTRVGEPVATTRSGADIYESDAGYVLCFEDAGVEAVIDTGFDLDLVTRFDVRRS
jgi:hypothetical protein